MRRLIGVGAQKRSGKKKENFTNPHPTSQQKRVSTLFFFCQTKGND
jgi:hypothetical protein